MRISWTTWRFSKPHRPQDAPPRQFDGVGHGRCAMGSDVVDNRRVEVSPLNAASCSDRRRRVFRGGG